MIFSSEFLESLLNVAVPLGIFLAAIATILIVTSQMVSSYYGRLNVLINTRRLRKAMIMVVIAFMVTMAIIVFIIVMDPKLVESHIRNTTIFHSLYF